MNILFIVPSYKPAYVYGGPVVVISKLAETLAKLGNTVTVYTTTANGKTELELKEENPVLLDGVYVYYFKRITKDHTHISPELWKKLNTHIKEFDSVHIHSWWNILVLGATAICRLHKINPLLSPHGMLSDYTFNTNNPFKKKIIHNTLGKKLLKNTYLHASTQLEWSSSLKVNEEWKGSIIPNLITLPSTFYEKRTLSAEIKLGVLSRIVPVKGLDILIKALAKVNFKYKLFIAGSGEGEYIQYLKTLAVTESNSDCIEWVGWKNGDEKFKFLANIDFLSVISHTENFAAVIIEALSVGTPVITSNNVGLHKYIEDRDYGWVVDMDTDHITQKLNDIILEKEKINRINHVVPAIIQEEFSDTRLAQKYLEMYRTNAIYGARLKASTYAANSLSVIVLTYNEEKHINRCIRNLQPIARDIYVIDSHSTDRTVEIASSLGAKVHTHYLQNNSSQFTWALENCPITTEWVMRIECDEYLTAELIEEINDILPRTNPVITGFFLKRRILFWRTGTKKIEEQWTGERLVLNNSQNTPLL